MRKEVAKTVGVVGLGYVGLPFAVEAAEAGHDVIGLDLSSERVGRIRRGEDVIRDIPEGKVAEWTRKGRLRATTDEKALSKCDVIVICVPTPLTKNKEPDLSFVEDAGRMIARNARPPVLVALESTTYPGTTREVLLPLLKEAGMKAGKDLYLAYSPERVDPGNPRFKTRNTPKIISGLTRECLKKAKEFYSTIVDEIVPVSKPETAEMAKLLENIFRNVNIALVNEMMLLADRMKIDIWEAVAAASTKPFGYMPFMPGPGVGGHCIPVDPYYLSWKAREFDFFTNFIDLSAEINENIPYYVVDRTVRAINRYLKRPLSETPILILGVTFKPDVDDVRNSPAFKIIERIRDLGGEVMYHDPLAGVIDLGGRRMRSVPLGGARARSARCLLIHSYHSSIDLAPLLDTYPLIVDTRNVTKGLKSGGRVVKI